MIVGTLGIVVLFFNGVPHTWIGRIAALAVTASVFVCAWGVVYASNAPARLTSTRAIAMQFAVCALVTLSLSVLLESHRQATWNLSSITALLFIGVFCTSLMVVLYYWLLKQIATFQVATIDLVVPVVAFLEGVSFLEEKITWTMTVAAAVVLASTAYVLRLTSPAPEPQKTSAASIQGTT
jgi:drug/metabolite transporter (DMT)-like permease